MAKLNLDRIKAHNREVSAGGVGKEKTVDIIDTVTEELPVFSKQVMETRRGELVDPKTHERQKPKDISLARAIELFFGITEPKVSPTALNPQQLAVDRDRRIVNRFMEQIGIYSDDDSLFAVGRKLGFDNLNKSAVENLLVDHGNFNNPVNTGNINSNYHFIIPELITNAIRLGYQASAMHGSWISGVQNVSQQKMTAPQIKRGEAVPVEINEGADIPMGSLQFGQKDVKVYKVGVGIALTDELILESTINMLNLFLSQYGIDMSISSDVRAINVLVNGEQADNSESAPVIGIDNTTNGLSPIDIDRVTTRMARLGMGANRMIGSEGDAYLDLNAAITTRPRLKLSDYAQRPLDVNSVPADHILLLNSQNAMVKLGYRSMLTERRRNPRNQTEELFISDWLGFMIVRRDARVLMNKSVTFAANPFPNYMDIDARITQDFASF